MNVYFTPDRTRVVIDVLNPEGNDFGISMALDGFPSDQWREDVLRPSLWVLNNNIRSEGGEKISFDKAVEAVLSA